jgi:hypothetical protein
MQLLGTGSQRSSKTSRILVEATPLTFASWEVNVTGEDAPTVNFESYDVADDQTYDEGILGPIACALRFGGDWDAGLNPYNDPPGLYPRDDLANLQFFTSRLDAVFWFFNYARLRSTTVGAALPGKVTATAEGRNQGRFLFPAGSV